MRFLLAGASGFLGLAWRDHLARQGHEVVRLVRGPAVSRHESTWDPYAGTLDQALVESADVVANLAGAPIAHWPWTASYKQTLLDSRVATTATLAKAVAASQSHPAFLAQNGVAGYGDRGDELLTEESSTSATSTLGHVTRAWAEATEPARVAGARVAVMRTGVVLHKSGGALKPLLLQFKAGAGSRLGDGTQYFPTISLADWLGAATFLATNPTSLGVYNVTGPEPVTNAEFTSELGRMVHRPTFLKVPAWPMRKVLGDLAEEFLASGRVIPARLMAEGYEFQHPTLNAQLAAALTD